MPSSVAINVDCMEFMRSLKDKTFDLAIVDPPYGINAPNMQMGGYGGYVSTARRIKKERKNESRLRKTI